MPNVSEINQELVRAFNINLCKNDIAITNLTVQNLHRNFHKEDHIVISFDKSMGADQCMKYLNDMKEKIVEEFCEDESSASMSFNISFFPFKFSKKQLNKDGKGRYKFSVPIDKGVIFNLKCCLAHVLAKDIKVDIGSEFSIKYAKENTGYVSFDRKSYLYCMRFNDWKLKVYFINSFSSKIARYEENAPRDYLEIIGNCVYIKKSIFDNVEFIKNIVKDKASLICRDFEVPSSEDEVVEGLKYPVVDFIRKMGIPVHSILRTSYKGNHEDSVLIPVAYQTPIVDQDEVRFLNNNDVNRINTEFGTVLLSNVGGNISARLPKSDSSDGIIYGIDFADVDIAYCVLNKIMESSIINKDHELAIDPELRLQALSPAQSPFNSPTHAEPPRTPPKQRQGDRDSGIGESPPRPEDSVAHSSSGDPGPSTELSYIEWESPMRSQGEELGRSARQGSGKEKEGLLYNHVDVPGTSGASWPSSSLRFVSSAQNVPAAQPQVRWSSPAPSAEPSLWQPSRPSSWKGANPVGANPWFQPIGYWSSPAPRAGFSSCSPSEPSSSKRPASVYSADSGYAGSLERPQSLPFTSFSTRASDKTVKAFLCFLNRFSSPEGKKQLPSLLSSEARKQLPSISCEQEELLDFLFSTEGKKQLCSLFSPENKQQLYSLFSPEGQKLTPSVLSPEGKEQLPLLLSPEGERISKPFSTEAGNLIFLLTCSHEEPKNMSHRSFRDKLERWLHRNPLLSKVASPQEKPLTNDEKKELRPLLSPKLQKQLDSNSLKNPQLTYLLYTSGGKKKLDLLLSSPEKEGKQLHSDLPFEAKKKLLPEFFDKQGISCNASTSSEVSDYFSMSSSQKSTSDDEDELEASGGFSQSGRSSVSSNSSTSTVRTKVDSLKLEQCSSKGIGGWI